MTTTVEELLASSLDSELVAELIGAYRELKEHFCTGKLRPAELEGGRFCEVAMRCLQELALGRFTPLSTRLRSFPTEVADLAKVPVGKASDSVRLHAPVLLKAIYDIRNRRDVGHVNPDVDPSMADATLVATVCDWVLAELVRLTAKCGADEAQSIVDGLVERQCPVVEDFAGFIKVLDPGLGLQDKILVVLYHRGKEGAGVTDLRDWLKPHKAASIYKALGRLEHEKAHIHRADGRCLITRAGTVHVEKNLQDKFPV